MFSLLKILAELEEMAIKGNQNKMVIKLAEAQAWANGYYEATRNPRILEKKEGIITPLLPEKMIIKGDGKSETVDVKLTQTIKIKEIGEEE